MVSKKVKDNVDGGLWSRYGHPDDDYEAAASRVQDEDGDHLTITFHHGAMPAFGSKEVEDLDELEAEMRKLQPDLRRWRKCG